MDLVLETCDRFFFDKFYSVLLPASLGNHFTPKWLNNLDLLYINNQTTINNLIDSQNRLNLSVPAEIYGYQPFLWEVTKSTFQSLLPRYNILREFFSLWVITTVFGWLLYLSMATFSYYFVFDRTIFNHPRYLKNQMRLEINLAMTAIPVMAVLTVPWFLIECNGHSKLYYWKPNKTTNWIILEEVCAFIFFTDCGVYFAHVWLHWPKVYQALHKPHHKWLVCTPFASHAFHPVDGYGQSLSYHIFPIIFPLQKFIYLGLFAFVNFWTIMIHDGNHMYNNKVVNGTACHTVHHLFFSYNYGQFTTLWDRLGGTYKRPDDSLFNKSFIKDDDVLEKQLAELDKEMKLAEGDGDDRVYSYDTAKKKN